MDDWGKLIETSLTEKEDFYNSLNVKHIADGEFRHAKRVKKF